MRTPLFTATCCALALLVTAAAGHAAEAASRVEVAFVAADRYIDAGDGPRDRQANQDLLEKHLQAQGERWLPAGEQLRIEVLDVDLAGRLPLARPSGPRVMTGGADWPRIHLRYARTDASGTVTRGDEWVTDMNYLNHPSFVGSSEPLRYETRMLSDWLQNRFGKPVASN